jgi:hypothetical protein
MRTRAWLRYVVAAMAVCVLAGCGGSTDGPQAGGPGTGGPRAPVAVASGDMDPTILIGSWQVADAGGQSGAVVQFGAGDVQVRADCGRLLGSWRANPLGMFVAGIHGWDGQCTGNTAPQWLATATGFRDHGDGPQLLDRDGQVTARLVPAGTRQPGESPQPYATPAPLPPGLVPADAASLLGRWHPVESPASKAFLELAHSGEWSGSDGCNGQGGRWVAGPDGALLATSGVTTLMACDNQVPVGSWLSTAARAGFDGTELVLLDVDGNPVGRLGS